MASKLNQRKGYRSFVTKTINTLDDIFASDAVETNRLHGFRQSLGEKLDILCALDTEIFGTLEEEDAITEEIDRSSEFRLKNKNDQIEK